MVPRWNIDADEGHKILLLLNDSYQKMSKKHSCKVLMGLAWNGWVLEHFWKSDFWPIFDIFLKMSLKLIPLHWNLKCNFVGITLCLRNVKITIIMPYYDFIVKVWNMDLADLFGPYRKRDEPYICSNGLELLIVRLFMINVSN